MTNYPTIIEKHEDSFVPDIYTCSVHAKLKRFMEIEHEFYLYEFNFLWVHKYLRLLDFP